MVSLLISLVIRLMNSKMTKTDYLKLLVDEIHSTTVATIGADGHPQTRIIDMMYYDKEGIYFLTAKGKEFYAQLMEQQYVAISATKEKIAISLRGRIWILCLKSNRWRKGNQDGILCGRRMYRM